MGGAAWGCVRVCRWVSGWGKKCSTLTREMNRSEQGASVRDWVKKTNKRKKRGSRQRDEQKHTDKEIRE